jgi:excisionase family DNA binding protein
VTVEAANDADRFLGSHLEHEVIMAATEDSLLTVQEVAQILKVPVSWVYEHTRGTCQPKLPHVKIGKYLRFFDADISSYLETMRARDGRRTESSWSRPRTGAA